MSRRSRRVHRTVWIKTYPGQVLWALAIVIREGYAFCDEAVPAFFTELCENYDDFVGGAHDDEIVRLSRSVRSTHTPDRHVRNLVYEVCGPFIRRAEPFCLHFDPCNWPYFEARPVDFEDRPAE